MGAKSVVFTLEKGGVDFVPTQQNTQRSPQSSGRRLSQFSVCAECRPSHAQGIHSCFPELRLQYLEESRLALSSTARPRKHDIILKQKRESWQIYWDGCDCSTHLAGQPLWKMQRLEAHRCWAVCALHIFIANLCKLLVSPVLVTLWTSLLSVSNRYITPCSETGGTRKKVGITGISFLLHP